LRGWVGEKEEEAIYSGLVLVDGAEEEIERIGVSPGGFLVETGQEGSSVDGGQGYIRCSKPRPLMVARLLRAKFLKLLVLVPSPNRVSLK
jgi:hypothetical protein